MVVEDATITVEALVEVLEEEVQLQEEKETLLQDVKVLVVVVLEATETQLQEKEVLEAKEALLQDVKVVHQKDQQDVLKALVIHQDQEDQEETNKLLLIF